MNESNPHFLQDNMLAAGIEPDAQAYWVPVLSFFSACRTCELQITWSNRGTGPAPIRVGKCVLADRPGVTEP